jgi:hypothetical protein
MIATRVARKATLSAVSAVALTAVALFTSGCTGFTDAVHSDTIPTTGAAIQGIVHGGRQPIVGAHVYLYAVGSGGYGAGATSLLNSSVVTNNPGFEGQDGSSNYYVITNGSGSFTITGDYPCTGNPLVYLLASGGNSIDSTGSTDANSATMLAAPLGACSSLSSGTTVTINEVTTAATAIALGQFFITSPTAAPTDNIGTSSTNSVGLTNAFATVNNLVNTSTGVAGATTSPLTGSGGSVTVAPETSKLNTIANILAACVNTTGTIGSPSTNCSNLFSYVKTASGTAPTDTLEAAVYMSLNPTSNNSGGSTTNLAALYTLGQTGTPPFAGVGTQPTDWTVGILYTDGTTSLLDPQNVAADASGNIWVVNHNSTTTGNLTELSPTGSPVLNVSTIGGTSMTALQPRNEAIDTNGNVWIAAATSPGGIFQYNTGTPGSSLVIADSKSPYGIAIDGSNNVFVTHESSSSTYTVYEFLGGNLVASTSEVQYPPYKVGGTTLQQPEYAAIDTSGNVWMTNGSSTSGLYNNIFQMSAFNGGTGGVCTVFPCNVASDSSLAETYTNVPSATGSIPTLNEAWGIAAGPSGVMWTPNTTGLTLTQMTSTTNGTDFGSATSLTAPSYVAVDGAGNVWVSNKSSSPGSVSEFFGTGTSLTTPALGAIMSPISGTTPFNVVGYSHVGIVQAQGITLDPSGNVWVANQTATTGGVFEIVGAGAPTVTPIALALKNGKVGALP